MLQYPWTIALQETMSEPLAVESLQLQALLLEIGLIVKIMRSRSQETVRE